MTVQLAVTLATLLVEDEYLVALDERRYYFAYYLGSVYCRESYCDCAVVVNQQYFLKLSSLTCFYTCDVVYEELLACLGLELLTVNLYDCVHFLFMCYNGFDREAESTCVGSLFEPLRHKSAAKL